MISAVVTAQAAVKRARGGTFTGLEVAHIYPLMAVGVVSTDLCHRIHLSHLLHIGRLDTVPECDQNVNTIVRFDKSGAMVFQT